MSRVESVENRAGNVTGEIYQPQMKHGFNTDGENHSPDSSLGENTLNTQMGKGMAASKRKRRKKGRVEDDDAPTYQHGFRTRTITTWRAKKA